MWQVWYIPPSGLGGDSVKDGRTDGGVHNILIAVYLFIYLFIYLF